MCENLYSFWRGWVDACIHVCDNSAPPYIHTILNLRDFLGDLLDDLPPPPLGISQVVAIGSQKRAPLLLPCPCVDGWMCVYGWSKEKEVSSSSSYIYRTGSKPDMVNPLLPHMRGTHGRKEASVHTPRWTYAHIVPACKSFFIVTHLFKSA